MLHKCNSVMRNPKSMVVHKDILIVDDEADIRDLVADILEDEGYHTRQASNSDEVFHAFAERVPDAVVLDIWLKDSGLDGLGILEILVRKYQHTPVVVMSGHGTIKTAASSLKMGAYDYIEKPFTHDRLVNVVKKAIRASELSRENRTLRQQGYNLNALLGKSQSIVQLQQIIDQVAATSSRVFLKGEKGVGKEAVARMIHRKSARKTNPFIVLNTYSLDPENIAHVLFGTKENDDIHAKGRTIGLLERAEGGTLFIDDVSRIPLETQLECVRFLQSNQFKRVGEEKELHADVRVIASTDIDPIESIQLGLLREDFFHRLNLASIEVPALRERTEDIALLCDYYLTKAAEQSRLPKRTLAEDAIIALQAHHWPGNLHQLRNAMEWIIIMCPGYSDTPVTTSMIEAYLALSNQEHNTEVLDKGTMISLALKPARDVFERQYLSMHLKRFNGNISRTAKFVGMERSALHRKLRLLHIKEEA